MGKRRDGDALTWGLWQLCKPQDFLKLLNETYPEVELEFVYYKGEQEGVQLGADARRDISDNFITSDCGQDLRGALVIWSSYPFINDLSTSVLHEVSIDGGIYLLRQQFHVCAFIIIRTLMTRRAGRCRTILPSSKRCARNRKEGMIPASLPRSDRALFRRVQPGQDQLADHPGGKLGTRLFGGEGHGFGDVGKTRWITCKLHRHRNVFHVDPRGREQLELIEEYLGGRKAVFLTRWPPFRYQDSG